MVNKLSYGIIAIIKIFNELNTVWSETVLIRPFRLIQWLFLRYNYYKNKNSGK